MVEHAPPDYQCPFCRFVQGGETAHNTRGDVVYEDDAVVAFISPKWWPNNPGHVIVIPKRHFENVYSLPDALLTQIMLTGKRVALAMKSAYQCDGTSFRQHNEPAGDQDVWHFHLHVFPRWRGDDLYRRHDGSRIVTAEERRIYAAKLRSVLDRPSAVESPPAGVSVASLGPEHWQDLRAIRLEALRFEPRAFSASYEETCARPDEDWRRRLANDRSVHLIARLQGQPIGMVGGYLGSDDGDESVAVVFGLYVNQEHRGKGVGRLLLHSLIDRLSEHSGIATIRLWVSASQQSARRLYESVGFRVVGRSTDPHGDEFIMELWVR